MKKWVAIIVLVVIIIIAAITYKYKTIENDALRIDGLNREIEYYTDGQITGTSLITLMNLVTDLNNKNNVELDEKGFYIENNSNSINIDIKFLDSDETFKMEQIEKQGSAMFVKNFAAEYFKCTKKEYHESNKMVKYLFFEQVNEITGAQE